MSFRIPDFEMGRTPPANSDFGIGIIGVGYIAELGHIPAFQKAGYRLVAAADLAAERRQFVRTVGIEMVLTDYRALLDLPTIDIVDVTIPQSSPDKLRVVHDVIDAGKHLLVEKPLTMDYSEARSIVEHANEAGVKLAICHQYRWMPVFNAIKKMVDQGYLGELFFLSMDERRSYDYPDNYYNDQARWLILMDAIHFIDQFRWWTGREPQRVFASLSRRPGQFARGEMLASLILEFGDYLLATYVGNDASYPQSQYHHMRLEGTAGVIRAHFNDLFGPGALEYSAVGTEPVWFRPQLEGNAFPDSFSGLMDDLMHAIATDTEPTVSGADHLKTLKVVFAAYESETNRCAVSIEDAT